MGEQPPGRAAAPDAPLPLELARERMLEGIEALPLDDVPLAEALGRVLAAPVRSLVTLPPFDNSAMDGFAVRAADVASASGASPVALRVIGEVAAGHAPRVFLGPREAVRVLTGAMMPPGADAVVPVEETDGAPGVTELPEAVEVRIAAASGAHIRRRGGDVVQGEDVLEAGATVTPAVVALAAATGHVVLPVHRRPRVAILGTGDELVAVGQPLGPAQIHDSNSTGLAAQARAMGADVRLLGVARDDLDDVLARLDAGVAWADIVVVSGGVSVGARDVVRLGFERLGRIDLWRVAVQPGKPLAYGRAPRQEASGEALLFGLPGNPVSSFVTFELFVRPVIRCLGGHADVVGRRRFRVRLVDATQTSHGRRTFLRVRLSPEPARDGVWLAELAGGQGSHVLSALAHAEALAEVPEALGDVPAGTELDAWRLDEGAL